MKNYFKLILVIGSTLTIASCGSQIEDKRQDVMSAQTDSMDVINSRIAIAALLDTLNLTAARADYDAYFNCFSEESIFIGTDATENWNKKEFMVWAKPYFDRGKAWNFSSVYRNIYFDKSGTLAWFDELLNTQMKICRGSGVVAKEGADWKIKQYVLSMTIPNSISDSVVSIKANEEDSLLTKMSH